MLSIFAAPFSAYVKAEIFPLRLSNRYLYNTRFVLKLQGLAVIGLLIFFSVNENLNILQHF